MINLVIRRKLAFVFRINHVFKTSDVEKKLRNDHFGRFDDAILLEYEAI